MDFLKKNVSDVEREPVATQATPQPVVVKKRSAWSTVAFLFLLLLLLSLGASAWLWSMWQDSQNDVATSKSELTAATTTIANLREQLGKANGQVAAEAALPINDEEAIKTAVKNYNDTMATPLKNVKIEVAKKDGSQAIASVADATSGYKAYLKKVNNEWMVVWTGQNTPPADVVAQFGLTI